MSTTTRVSGKKGIREEARVLHRLGFTYARRDSKGHPVYTHPRFGEITLASASPAHRLAVARLMGLTLRELEALIHGQARVGKRTRKPRARKAKQQKPRTLRLAPALPVEAPAAVKAPRWKPSDPITPARVKHWERACAERDRLNAIERGLYREPEQSEAA